MTDHPKIPTPVPRRSYWWILWSAALTAFTLDQLTKWIVIENLDYRETWEFWPLLSGIFDFTYTRNTGAAFGIGQGMGSIFLIIAIVVSLIIIFSYRQLPPGSWPVRLAMGMMMGGALGNAVDRVRYGYVVDFLHLHGWPIFNIADSMIVVGVGIWMIAAWWDEHQQANDAEEQPTTNEDASTFSATD